MSRTFNKAWCMFEQSGTFKNEFIKLGIPAVDLDIQNNFGETDYVIDLFGEIEKEYAILQRERERRYNLFADWSRRYCYGFFSVYLFFGNTNDVLQFKRLE